MIHPCPLNILLLCLVTTISISFPLPLLPHVRLVVSHGWPTMLGRRCPPINVEAYYFVRAWPASPERFDTIGSGKYLKTIVRWRHSRFESILLHFSPSSLGHNPVLSDPFQMQSSLIYNSFSSSFLPPLICLLSLIRLWLSFVCVIQLSSPTHFR